MQKEDLVSKMIQSQAQFKNQFDKNNPNYHKGDKTIVPLGGQRIPQSMPTTYPQNYNPNQSTQQIDYGQQYKKVQNDRTVLQNLKKSLAKLGPVLEAFLRHQQTFKQKGDPTNQKHIKTHQQHMVKQKQNLLKVQEQLSGYLTLLDNIGEDGKLTSQDLKKLIDDSNKKYDNKESLTDFNFRVKKLSTKVFGDAQKCLQKLKDIKKSYKKVEQPKNQ